MADFIYQLSVIIGTSFALVLASASIMTGVIIVCRWAKWAPINITVNVCQHDEDSETRSLG